MNKVENDILLCLKTKPFTNQRNLASETGHSLGMINKSLKELIHNGYLNDDYSMSQQGLQLFNHNKPQRAIILAAGFGMRMVPINTETPKAFLEVNGERLIERIIKQLHKANIHEIKVVVGFMKESFEYLIDEYNVELIVNTEYSSKNNLHSLYLARKYLNNTYIIPSDIWCDYNPFNLDEIHSWYMVSELIDDKSNVRVTRKNELAIVDDKSSGNSMLGISYVCGETSQIVQSRLEAMEHNLKYASSFWEETLYKDDKMQIMPKVVQSSQIVEVNTYEQLRELDDHSLQLKNDAIDIICHALQVENKDIVNISVLKKGMTNRSFLFECKNKKYIMRIPGEGTDMLINRKEEAEVYLVIKDKRICDEIIYINPDNGYKITEFIENTRVCDAGNERDLILCMKRLKAFHDLKLKVSHEFDIFKQIHFYESLWNQNSVYRDYSETKENVLRLKKYVDSCEKEYVLTHIDAVPDNFLFNEKNDIRLIDWEYAAMQDPHVDLAMFSIYSFYTKEQIDHLIDLYFENECDKQTRIKIYCYVAMCGLLWSNWCEYKRQLGVEFGEYSLKQYRYAKEFYRLVEKEGVL